jgi:hypothetical protein
MIIKCKCFRSKKTRRFFRFEQYFDYGYGKYRDSVSTYDFHKNGYAITLPDLFPLSTEGGTFYEFDKHNKDEIEEVMVTITIEGVEHDK